MNAIKFIVATITFSLSLQIFALDMYPLWKDLNEIDRKHYSNKLNIAKSNPINSVNGEKYRFLWIRSFDPVVHVSVICEDKCILNAARLNCPGRCNEDSPEKITVEASRILQDNEVAELRKLFQNSNIRNTISVDPENKYIMDGAHWIFDAAHNDKYTAVDVISPTNRPEFRNYAVLCLYLLILSNLNIDVDDVY